MKIKAEDKLYVIDDKNVVEVEVDKVGKKYFYLKSPSWRKPEGIPLEQLSNYFTSKEEAEARIELNLAATYLLGSLIAAGKLKTSTIRNYFPLEEMQKLHARLQVILMPESPSRFQVGDKVRPWSSPMKLDERGVPHRHERARGTYTFLGKVRVMGHGTLVQVVDRENGFDNIFYLMDGDLERAPE
jgi:hypothetical protein